MNVSVVIPTLDRPSDLIKAVESLVAQSTPPFEIIIVDSSNEKKYKQIEIALNGINFKEIKVFHFMVEKQGLTFSRNIGIARCTQEIVLFIDDDVILDKEYIKDILDVYISHPKAMSVGASVLFFSKKHVFWRIFRRFFFLTHSSKTKSGLLPSGYALFLEPVNELTRVEVLPGHNMSYRKRVFLDFKFDETLKGYCHLEDVDFSYRVSRKYQIFLTPEAKLVHNTFNKSFGEGYHEMKIYHHYLVFNKLVPRNAKTMTAYYISVLGDLILALAGTIVDKKSDRLKGFFKGVYKISKTQKKRVIGR